MKTLDQCKAAVMSIPHCGLKATPTIPLSCPSYTKGKKQLNAVSPNPHPPGMKCCGLPWWLSRKESACHAEDTGDTSLIPGLGRSPGEGYGNPLQYSWRIPWTEELDRL